MKKNLTSIVIIFALSICTAYAQTPGEFLQQKKTQRQYLLKQIALLKTYLGYLKKGYDIANKGLTTIHTIKNGDFQLHRDFFASLKNVNPAIASSTRIADILSFQASIIKTTKRTKDACRNNELLTPEEIRYADHVLANLLELTEVAVTELLFTVQPNEAEMRDDERLRRVDKVYRDLQDKHAFVKSFENDIHMMIMLRQKERVSNETINKLYHENDN